MSKSAWITLVLVRVHDFECKEKGTKIRSNIEKKTDKEWKITRSWEVVWSWEDTAMLFLFMHFSQSKENSLHSEVLVSKWTTFLYAAYENSN